MGGRQILVVEDEYLIRFSLVEALTDDGFSVLEAQDAEEALHLAADGSELALMLTDLQLPGPLDGWALAERLRQLRPQLPVIFVTGRPDRARGACRDRDRVIGKPYHLSDICAAAREMVDG